MSRENLPRNIFRELYADNIIGESRNCRTCGGSGKQKIINLDESPRPSFECGICCETNYFMQDKIVMQCCKKIICRGCSHKIYFGANQVCAYCRTPFIPQGLDSFVMDEISDIESESDSDDDIDVDAYRVIDHTWTRTILPNDRPGDDVYFRNGRCPAYRNVGAIYKSRCRQRMRRNRRCPFHRL